jgi:hypothetical protein
MILLPLIVTTQVHRKGFLLLLLLHPPAQYARERCVDELVYLLEAYLTSGPHRGVSER